MFPLARHLMARVYLVTALATGVVIGYVLGRVEAHFEINAISSAARATDNTSARARTIADNESSAEPTPVVPEPVDDLEHAARRLDERARRADRLGDPKLADFWRDQAAELRRTLHQRSAKTGAQVSAINTP